MDNGHSFINDSWQGRDGNRVRGIRNALISIESNEILKAGANLTSQSTTGMGHDIANNATLLYRTERLYYFADVLRSGPAHISYVEPQSGTTIDHYQALSPIYYNSIGSSGSETKALTKMVVAGAYLSRKLKNQLKKNGLYPSTLLYLWKAGLPYKAPYAHELRHRTAYVSLGNLEKSKALKRLKAHELAYFYDDTLHLQQMVELAKDLQDAPPEVIFTVMRNSGGEVVYFLKKTILVRQKAGQTIKLRISLNDSYDLQGKKMQFDWKVLYGHQNITIKRDGQSKYYDLTIPYEKDLPRGRTAILCTAHNNKSFGNPAVLNIYRDWGPKNQRPVFEPIANQVIHPGETLEIELKARDPEGFPVHFAQWAGQVGKIKGRIFTWKCPENHPLGKEKVTIIVSDKTNGNCYTARRFDIQVKEEDHS
jgi:hypothetical protein